MSEAQFHAEVMAELEQAEEASLTLTFERLRYALHYNPETGVFTSLVHRGKCPAGKAVGSPSQSGHLRIRVDYRRYAAHRLAWFYMTGAWPVGQIDHVNGDPLDNRIANLRDTTASVNMQNRRGPQSNNKAGFLGVHLQGGKYMAKIKLAGKITHLGSFETPEEASAAYLARKREIHAGCTI